MNHFCDKPNTNFDGTICGIAIKKLTIVALILMAVNSPALAQRREVVKTETTIKCGAASTKITLPDLKKMSAAIRDYCEKNHYPDVPPNLKQLVEMCVEVDNRPFIEDNGTAHAGQWVLSGTPDGPLLTLKFTTPKDIQFLARLQKNGDSYKVTSFEKKVVKPGS